MSLEREQTKENLIAMSLICKGWRGKFEFYDYNLEICCELWNYRFGGMFIGHLFWAFIF
jgi:hypothetical protein